MYTNSLYCRERKADWGGGGEEGRKGERRGGRGKGERRGGRGKGEEGKKGRGREGEREARRGWRRR